jgi:predicted metalloprotease
MRTRGRRGSSNVEDARGKRVAAGVGAGALINFVLRRFGIKGVLVLGAVGIVAWQLGLVEPAALVGGSQVRDVPYEPSPAEQERYEFVEVVLADTEDVWSREFTRLGENYLQPQLVVYTEQYPTGCGMGDARMGPFYCPADQRIYIDLGFYDELEQGFNAPGDFAQAYVIAHEVGHHVQNLLGISEQVQRRQGQPDYNEWSVRLELQADYLAGVWARQNQEYLDAGDIEEAMRAANRIGDDAIQLRSQGRVVPHAFTHGSSEQRMRWFNRGLQSGRLEDGDTFKQPYDSL